MMTTTLRYASCRALALSLLFLPQTIAAQTAGKAPPPTAPATKAKFALLVGIDQYPKPYDLDGCVADVKEMQALLTSEKFGFPKDNVHALTNQQATHAAIAKEFKDFLVAN